MPVELVALSPSPSVTVTTASSALSVIDTESSGLVASGCFSEAYCATLTTPLVLLIATANAAAPPAPPIRPTTRLPSLNRKMLVPLVVSRPESTPAAETSSENAVVPPSWSAPNALPVELTTAVASCAKPAGFRSLLTLLTPANSAATAGLVVSSASAWTPAVSSCATVGAPCTIAAVGPSSWNCTASPMPVELVAVSPSPSVTVATASNALSVIDTESSGLAPSGCFSEAYCATLTTPLALLIATANAAAPAAEPMRPTTRSPSLNRKMLAPLVVSRPESTPAADTASENAVVPPSWSAPNELPVELTTAVASCAKPVGFRSVLTLVTPANSATTPAAVVSSASAWTPAVSSCATVAAPCTIPAVGPSSWNCTASPIPVELVAVSPSPSVTVTTASNALSVIDTESSGLVPSGCFSEAYCATLTTPLVLLIATANAAAPPAPPLRPTTRLPSLNRKMLVPLVVSRPESTPAAETSSENAVVPPSWSAPNALPVELTTAVASCAKPAGLRSVLTLLTPANSAATAGSVVSSASACTPAVSSCATVAAPCTIAAVGPSSWHCTASPMPVELVALSPSPSVTVTTASNALSVIDTESSGLVPSGCFSEAYCAVLTTPLVPLIATANAAAPAAPPMRPTTRAPSLNRKMLVPSVVSRPESTPAADTASENTVVPPSWSAPNELPVEVTTGFASCA